MNKVILVGRLVKDPELRKTNNDISVVQFTIAVNRTYQTRNGEKTADFINCVAWRNLAELLAKYMRKGSLMGVEGQLQVRTYEDQNGAKKYVTEVICDNIHFLESKGARENGGFSDINSYDIPNNSGFNSSNQLAGTSGPSPFDIPNQQKSSNKPEDPFARFATKSGVSDDDLPF